MNLGPEIVWFLVGLVLMILEFAAPGVVLIFFGTAAWIVALTTYMGLTGSLASQLILFSISTIALLVGLRKWIRDKFVGHVSDVQNLEVDLDEFTGKSAIVLEDIEPGRQGGKVEFKGADWSARSDETIKKGETGIISGMDGLTLIIKRS